MFYGGLDKDSRGQWHPSRVFLKYLAYNNIYGLPTDDCTACEYRVLFSWAKTQSIVVRLLKSEKCSLHIQALTIHLGGTKHSSANTVNKQLVPPTPLSSRCHSPQAS